MSLVEKIAMFGSLASIFVALLMFELITPIYKTITSLLFNNGVVLILFIIATYWSFGRDVKAFTEHQDRIYIFSRIIVPGIGLIFFGENLATYVGFGPFVGNLIGIIACLVTIVFGALEELQDHPHGEEFLPVEDIAMQELRNILAEEQKNKVIPKDEPSRECETLVH